MGCTDTDQDLRGMWPQLRKRWLGKENDCGNNLQGKAQEGLERLVTGVKKTSFG